MFFPVGDTPNPRGFVPWVTWLLIGINVLVHMGLALPASFQLADPGDPLVRDILARLPPGVPITSLTQWDLFVEQHGFVPGDPSLRDLFVSMFLHANLAHLLGNMLFLWIYGDNVEAWLGRPAYLLAYLGTGAAATLSFSAFAADPLTPLVGASGAISGVLGLYFYAFPRNQVKVLAGFPPFLGLWLVPAPIVLGLFVVVDNLLPLFISQDSAVAYGAHLGGFVAGLIVAVLAARLLIGRAPQEEPSPRRLRAADQEDRAAEHLRQGQWLASRGQTAAAFQHLVRAVELSSDPAVRARAREILRAMDLDPRLLSRFGL